jgi:hypothetical protein
MFRRVKELIAPNSTRQSSLINGDNRGGLIDTVAMSGSEPGAR